MSGVELALEETAQLLERLVTNASNRSVATKLRNLNDVCRAFVIETKQRLTVPAVLSEYKVRFPDADQALSEQTIRNKRTNGNPYQTLYRKWEDVAEHWLATHQPPTSYTAGAILAETDIRKIEDVTLRHQVFLLFAQNRSLHNQLNIIKQTSADMPIQLVGSGLPSGGAYLVLTDAEVEAVRDFIDPRKLRARHLARTKGDGVSMRDGNAIADPGFVTALEKIVRSYQRP